MVRSGMLAFSNGTRSLIRGSEMTNPPVCWLFKWLGKPNICLTKFGLAVLDVGDLAPAGSCGVPGLGEGKRWTAKTVIT